MQTSLLLISEILIYSLVTSFYEVFKHVKLWYCSKVLFVYSVILHFLLVSSILVHFLVSHVYLLTLPSHMSEISEEDPIKISEDVPRLSEAVSKVPTRPRMCFAEKASLQSFWLEIRILGEQTWLWFSDCWKSNCPVFKSETESAFQKLNFLFLKVELTNLIFKY